MRKERQTRRASEMVVPPDSIAAKMTEIIADDGRKSYRDLITDALMEKYGIAERELQSLKE